MNNEYSTKFIGNLVGLFWDVKAEYFRIIEHPVNFNINKYVLRDKDNKTFFIGNLDQLIDKAKGLI